MGLEDQVGKDQVGENEGVFVNKNGEVRSYISRGLHYGILAGVGLWACAVPLYHLYKAIIE